MKEKREIARLLAKEKLTKKDLFLLELYNAKIKILENNKNFNYDDKILYSTAIIRK